MKGVSKQEQLRTFEEARERLWTAVQEIAAANNLIQFAEGPWKRGFQVQRSVQGLRNQIVGRISKLMDAQIS